MGIAKNFLLNLLHGLRKGAIETGARCHFPSRIEVFFERGLASVRADQLAAASGVRLPLLDGSPAGPVVSLMLATEPDAFPPALKVDAARLDPRPGARYASANTQYVIPDLIVEKIGDRYPALKDTYRVARERRIFGEVGAEAVGRVQPVARGVARADHRHRPFDPSQVVLRGPDGSEWKARVRGPGRVDRKSRRCAGDESDQAEGQFFFSQQHRLVQPAMSFEKAG